MSTTPQMITPQVIKDQEFQVKFRGYDPLEVKAYLDVIAEEFFELQERCRLQIEDLQAFHEASEELEQQKASLEAGSNESRKMAEELRKAGLQMEQRLVESGKDAEMRLTRISLLEQEKQALTDELKSANAKNREAQEALVQESAKQAALSHKIKMMEEQQQAARKDEVDFKSTLAAAQQFCDSMKEKSRQQADQLLDAARAEVEAIRQAAHAELASLPEEIQALQQKREEARKILRTTLETYLQNLDIFPDESDKHTSESAWGSDDLFQKIQILADGSLNPDDLAALNPDNDSDLLSLLGGDKASGDN